MSQKPLPGFRDFYPAEMAERTVLTRTWREVAQRAGFVEYDGPPLEPLELYTKKSGDEIVGQLFNFTDKGGREVSLRPEMTPTLARMVGARANALRKPVRWFSMPQLFRYEKAQRGRLREHFQLNVDIIGESDVTADAELLSVAIEIMRALGLTHDDVVARVSDRRLLTALLAEVGVVEAALPSVYAVIDKLEREPREVSVAALGRAGLDAATVERVLALVTTSDFAALRAAHAGSPGLAPLFEQFERYLGYLGALGVAEWVRFDLTIVRGLAYYTGIVFELFDRKGELRAICGGGRYDNLLKALGGADLPALGFGMGDVVLGLLLHQRGLMPSTAPRLDYWVAGADAALLPKVMEVAAALRRRGRSVEYALRDQALGRQLKSAGAAGAERVVILPSDAAEGDTARIKSLVDGSEQQVLLAEWLRTA